MEQINGCNLEIQSCGSQDKILAGMPGLDQSATGSPPVPHGPDLQVRDGNPEEGNRSPGRELEVQACGTHLQGKA